MDWYTSFTVRLLISSENENTERMDKMFQITKIQLELLSLKDLFKVRDAISQLHNLDIREVDIDVANYVNLLINKKEQTQI